MYTCVGGVIPPEFTKQEDPAGQEKGGERELVPAAAIALCFWTPGEEMRVVRLLKPTVHRP